MFNVNNKDIKPTAMALLAELSSYTTTNNDFLDLNW